MNRGVKLSILLACSVLWMACPLAPPLPPQTLFVGDPAPPLTIAQWLKGDPVDPTAADGETIFVIEFFATTCPHCRDAFPVLSALQEQYADEGVVIVGISRENPSVVQGFLDQMGYTVAIDDQSASWRAYATAAGRIGVPVAFVVDPQGTIAWIGNPLHPGMEQTIETLTTSK